jgi:hypothetical protein
VNEITIRGIQQMLKISQDVPVSLDSAVSGHINQVVALDHTMVEVVVLKQKPNGNTKLVFVDDDQNVYTVWITEAVRNRLVSDFMAMLAPK